MEAYYVMRDIVCYLTAKTRSNNKWDKKKKRNRAQNKNNTSYSKKYYKIRTNIRLTRQSRTNDKIRIYSTSNLVVRKYEYSRAVWKSECHKNVTRIRRTSVRKRIIKQKLNINKHESTYLYIKNMTSCVNEHMACTNTYYDTCDTDSYYIGIDTLSTYCMTDTLEDFIGTPQHVQHIVKGVSGPAHVTHKGEGRFPILDDKGMLHQIIIPELYYCSTLPFKVISPQHLDNLWRAK